MKGTGWGFPYMVSLNPTKTVAQREGADSRAHFGPLDLETGWSNPGNKKVLVKGTGWGFPYMVSLKPTKTVAQSEGADG